MTAGPDPGDTAARDTAARYPALPLQRGMVLGTLRHPAGGVDVMQVTIIWDEPLDRLAFTQTWRAAVARHPALRTSFVLHGAEGVVQVVQRTAQPDLRWRELPPEDFLSADRFEPFDVGRAPLFRVTVLGGTQVVFTVHHAILDGRSLPLLLDEVISDYAALRAGLLVRHPSRPPFADFVRWWQAADLSVAEPFWAAYLTGAPALRSLPGYLGAGDGTSRAIPATDEISLTRAESDRVRALAAELGTSPGSVINAAWAWLRGAYAGTGDVTFAVTRSARHGSVPRADDIIGMLITTVPLRIRLDPGWTVRELVDHVATRTREVRDHQLAPLASILSWAGLPADPPPLDSLVIFERERLATTLARLGPDPPRASARNHRLPGFPLTLYAFDEPELRLAAMWDGRRLLSASARHMLRRLGDTVRYMATRPGAYLSGLDPGGADEDGRRAGGNAARPPYPREATVPSLFAAQVAAQPDAPALVAGGRTVSYAELDRDTDRVARALAEHGVGPDMLVAVAVPRGASLIRALLGVLKAGGAYLPLDLGAPPARTAAVLAAAHTRLALAQVSTTGRLPSDGTITILDIDALTSGPAPPGLLGSPATRIHPLQLAYVGYTSGSTGTPKGVAVPHRAVVRLVAAPDFARLGPGERVLQFAPAAFDASTWEIWGALCTGATVVVAPADPLGFTELAALLRGGEVTMAWLTAGLFHQLADVDVAALADVGQLLTGGDLVNPAAVRAVLAVRGGRPVVNGYGPTENTTFTTCHVMTGPEGIGERVPIGVPVPQTTVHVLGTDLRPVPVGVTGELYAGGDGLARGYLGDAAATASSFVPDPAGGGGRLYRTGDLARWRADGVLEFLGRRDDQVKIRGFRVEPAEVEAVIAGHPQVGVAAVRVGGGEADRHLVAYVSPAGQAMPTPEALRAYAAARLPEYQVPVAYLVLDRLPLTANGKIDRTALPSPAAAAAGADPAGAGRAGPATRTERRLAEVWSGLLPVNQPDVIARDASFFALGGNSLTAARLISQARGVFGVELALGSFYQAPTLAAMAAVIDTAVIDTAVIGTAVIGTARIGTARPADAAGQNGRPVLRRRNRDAHRVADDSSWPRHLVRLTEGWALWRTICLRGAGFPAGLLSALGDEALARAADAANTDAANAGDTGAAYLAEFARAVRRLGHALRCAAAQPAFREAITWQNPHALATGVDALRRHDPGAAARNAKHRQHESLVTSYLQRYCAKNDTIGFFGPVGWASFGPGGSGGPGGTVRIDHPQPAALVAARDTYLEGWAVTAALAPHTSALRPWLTPRRMPFVAVDGLALRVPLAPPVSLTRAEAAVLQACDGLRAAHEVAATVLADPVLADPVLADPVLADSGLTSVDQVYAVLDAAAEAHRIAWRVEVPPQDMRPEESIRTLLARVSDEPVRAAAAATLDELCAARDAVADAAGEPERLATAMAAMGSTFTRLSGAAPTRRAGTLYGGRTPVYQDCRRAGAIELGEAMLDPIRVPLGLVLDSARWYTAAGAALYRRLFDEVYRRRAAELGRDVVPFADFWLRIAEIMFDPPAQLTGPLVRALQRRWAEVLGLPPGRHRRVRRTSAELTAAAAAAFPAGRPGWPTAVQHSPDLMIAADSDGRAEWVLGELHPGLNTMRYATLIARHPSPQTLRAAMLSDLGRGVVYAAETGEEGGVPARQGNALAGPRDLRFVFAHDSFGYPTARTLPVGECDLVRSPAGLRVRRAGGVDLDLTEVLGDLIAIALSQLFRILAPDPHTPRITIDGLVVSRESWTFQTAELAFSATADEARRYAEARAWVTRAGLPRHVFLRCAGERKPVYADLTGLASIDLLARSVRRARRSAGDTAQVTVTEMLPGPGQLWLTDAHGELYSAELRVVAVDRKAG